MPQTKVDIEAFYWKGQLRYKCPLMWEGGTKCEYDAYDIDILRKHMSAGHRDEVKTEIVKTHDIPDQKFTSKPDEEFKSVNYADDPTPKV